MEEVYNELNTLVNNSYMDIHASEACYENVCH